MGYRPTPRFNVNTVEWKPYVEWGGQKAILHVSDDGTLVAGSFREEGTNRVTMPFDQFIYIVAGRMKVTVHGGDEFEMGPGDCCYMFAGDDVTYVQTDGFHDVTVLMSSTRIDEFADDDPSRDAAE
jgi:uncharacterized cupin superfamily protein